MKCGDCGQDILQIDPEMCPYCRSKNLIAEEDVTTQIAEAEALAKSKRFEEAALIFEKLELWDKAKDCRVQAKKSGLKSAELASARVESVALICPHCGWSQAVASNYNEETCARCGKEFLVPFEVAGLVFEKKP
jgi:DNA-directed RNA polymerase subunit RPC12/RpoP